MIGLAPCLDSTLTPVQLPLAVLASLMKICPIMSSVEAEARRSEGLLKKNDRVSGGACGDATTRAPYNNILEKIILYKISEAVF